MMDIATEKLIALVLVGLMILSSLAYSLAI